MGVGIRTSLVNKGGLVQMGGAIGVGIRACAMMEQKMYGESTDEGGRRGERRGSGREEDRKRKKSAVLRAVAVAWVSPILTPCRAGGGRDGVSLGVSPIPAPYRAGGGKGVAPAVRA
eukprot:scaffold19246_cov73-Isochrysis_galbana.AAC.1